MKHYFIFLYLLPGIVMAEQKSLDSIFKKPTALLEEVATQLINFGLPFFTVAAVVSAYMMYNQRMSRHWFFSSCAGAFILLMARYVMQFFFGYFQ